MKEKETTIVFKANCFIPSTASFILYCSHPYLNFKKIFVYQCHRLFLLNPFILKQQFRLYFMQQLIYFLTLFKEKYQFLFVFMNPQITDIRIRMLKQNNTHLSLIDFFFLF